MNSNYTNKWKVTVDDYMPEFSTCELYEDAAREAVRRKARGDFDYCDEYLTCQCLVESLLDNQKYEVTVDVKMELVVDIFIRETIDKTEPRYDAEILEKAGNHPDQIQLEEWLKDKDKT